MSTRPAAEHADRPSGASLPTRTPSFTPARKSTQPRAAHQDAERRSVTGTYTRADLPPEPAAAAHARRLTRDALDRWDLRHLGDDAETIASELAANAIRAAVPPRAALPAIIFAVHQRPGELRIIVWDNGPGRPLPADPGPDAETGRGLAIIATITGRNWGWWPTPHSGGKVVWAALPTADSCHDRGDRPC